MGLNDKLISIIVPVYNVEPYLRKCLDSILAQTYRKLEILLVDDGSTDDGGKICDEYSHMDSRIRVFHTENRGLSAARNLGLDHFAGDYVGFVDPDDWIEPDMYEVLIQKAEETGSDIVECGTYEEYPSRVIKREKLNQKKLGSEAVVALLNGELSDNVWNKLWKRQCFVDVRFPENRLFEDIYTTYRIFITVQCVQSIQCCKYHYLQRKSSLSRLHSMKNLVDYWLVNYERYTSLKSIVNKKAELELYKCCARAIARAWAYYNKCTLEDRNSSRGELHDMHDFMRDNIPLFGCKDWDLILRIGCFFPHYYNALSFWMAWKLNRIKGKRMWARKY